MYFKVVNGSVEMDGKTILEQVNMEIKEHDHIAIVGRNGAGKTTLLNAIIHPELFLEGTSEESFSITKIDSQKIGFLKQNEGFTSESTLLDEILKVYEPIIQVEKRLKKLEEKLASGSSKAKDVQDYTELLEYYKNIGGYEYKKEYLLALQKNGFTEEDFSKKVSLFSGGEQTKIGFLKLLLSKPDLLILDEPTNHLDIEAILWLEGYLKNYPKSFLVVSHDRMFINQVANKIYEIEHGETSFYSGNYEYYEQEKERRRKLLWKSYEHQQQEIKRLQRIADRFRYKPSKARMAMSKLKQIERMVKIEEPKKENKSTFHVKFSSFLESGREVLEVDHLQFGYTQSLGEATFTLEKKRRLAVIGANGTGKSTLLKTIVGRVPKLSGKIRLGYHVTMAYFDQQFEDMDPTLTVYDEFKKSFPDKNEEEIRSSLARFSFSYEDTQKLIAVLSGGEKVLLQLCKVLSSGANFLVLDEPTNHLDILSKEKLEKILEEYPGTILFVSHDRYFIKKIATAILELTHDGVKYYDYGYENYLEKRILSEEKEDDSKSKEKKHNSQVVSDKKIDELEKKIDALKSDLYLEEVYMNQEKYAKIEAEIKALEEKLNQMMLDWD